VIGSAGVANNAAAALQVQVQQTFAPLLALATLINYNPDYQKLNASFDKVAEDILAQVRPYSSLDGQSQPCLAGRACAGSSIWAFTPFVGSIH
jgi:hypothetical protein